jgi:chorismate lyase/3-hydroxybenzoate synthase
VSLAASGSVLFGVAEAPAGEGPTLEAATRELYGEILAALGRSRHPHPLRFWNVFPHINRADRGLERYRWFCRGRAEALERHFGSSFETRLCAASAVGSQEGALLVYFLAAGGPGTQVENPRQLSAFRYPPEYGPRSPSFARATRCPDACGGGLLLSGTASIVGHRTLHAGDVRMQLRETLCNLERLTEGRPLRHLKVFVRHPEDLSGIREEIARRLGPDVGVLYLQADICRADLSLEIEGVAS